MALRALQTQHTRDYTARDVFYEQTFGLFTMVAATLAIVTSLNVSGRGLSILSMSVIRGDDGFMVLHYMAGENVNYGFNDPVILGVVLSLLALLGIAGFLPFEGQNASSETSP
ncbi:MAG: hypothetical protein CM15mP18_1850 [Methanobacteriota archaeon]|nr:MAG: hypothetical protein CM15mP18_1850 [Euryarchaeota archaeon]